MAHELKALSESDFLVTLYKSWVRPLLLNANACWIDQSNSVINNIQLTQDRALGTFLTKPCWYSVKKLNEEANILAVRDFQIRLANEYLKRAKENKIESIIQLIQKKQQRPKNSYQSTLDHLSYQCLLAVPIS